MARIGNVPEITAVKSHFEDLKKRALVQSWELPYENILTRLSAAVFFFSAEGKDKLDEIWKELRKYDKLQYRVNEEKKLSKMEWRVEFNKGVEA